MRAPAAWATLACLLGGCALAGWDLARELLDWQPTLASTQPWRAFSAVAVHYSRAHLLANLGALVLLAALGLAARVSWPGVWAWLAAWPLTQVGLSLRPDLAHYGGLSGVLHAGAAVLAIDLLVKGSRAQRGLGALMLAGIGLKVLSETPWGPALRAAPHWGISVAPFSHASGLLAGLLCAAVTHTLARLHRKPRIDRHTP